MKECSNEGMNETFNERYSHIVQFRINWAQWWEFQYSQDSLKGVGNNVSVPSFSWFKSMSQIVGLTATWQDKVEGNPTGAGTASNAKVNTNPVHTEFNFFL